MAQAGDAVGGGGSGGGAADQIINGWRAVSDALNSYATDALNWGKGLGETLTNAFSGAESAFRSFVETGKLDFKGLVRSILADLAVLAFKNAVLGPIANALSGAFGGGGSVAAAVSHAGGMVGISGHTRSVPAAVFAGAPRMHGGGTVGPAGSWAGLRPDEVPTILQRGERVLSRAEVARGGGGAIPVAINLNVDARGAQMGVAEQIAAVMRSAQPEFERIAVAAVDKAMRRIMFKSPMFITPLLPIAHRAGDRVTWLSSQWKLTYRGSKADQLNQAEVFQTAGLQSSRFAIAR